MVGYRYYTTKNIPVRFPFGYGLSYTTFSMSEPSHKVFSTKASEDTVLTVTATVTNTGAVTGKEVYQLYIGIPEAEQPLRVLKQFVKVELAPQQSKKVSLSIAEKDLMVYSSSKEKFELLDGEYHLYLGTSADDIGYEATFSPDNH